MGVVNVTPDSFSDGGLYFDADKAVEHALHLLDDGADLIDVGGESTRPGAEVKPGSSDIRSSETNKNSSSERTLSTKQAVTEKAELQRVQNISSTSVRPSSAAPARKDGRTTSAAP